MKLGSLVPNYIKIGITAGFTLATIISVSLVETFFDIDISRPAMIHEIHNVEDELNNLRRENTNLRTVVILMSAENRNEQVIQLLLNNE